MRATFLILVTLTLSACQDDDNFDEGAIETPVRGIKTITIAAREESTLRRFPSVLQPSELSVIAFEYPGKIGSLSLSVGQTFDAGDILVQLDDTEMRLQIGSAESVVEQARVVSKNAAEALTRANRLLKKGIVTKVSVDNAKAEAVSREQAYVQAVQSLEQSRERLKNRSLSAPFDGAIASVDVQSFATVAAGTPIATIYREGKFEARFTVNYGTVSQLVVGTHAQLVLADDPERILSGVVSEIGSRAETVSSFPVVVALDEGSDFIKAGMAVEVRLEFPLPASHGFSIPLSAAVIEGDLPSGSGPGKPTPIAVFVFDEASGTVKKREVMIAGVRENALLVIKGLSPGDKVASRGVSFLSDGMKAKLVE